MSQLAEWDNFYVIVGSSAAGLTGLMFVVITLVTSLPRRRSGQAISTFSTPTVVHFGITLLVAAVLSAPWQALVHITVVLVIVGLVGEGYTFIVMRRTRRQRDYEPVFEDWLFHVLLPFVAYTLLLVAAILLPINTTDTMLALFGIGTFTLLLLFVGIHNAWDTVTYLAVEMIDQPDEKKD